MLFSALYKDVSKKKYRVHRDDGPRIFKNMSGPEVERKKNLVRIWSITVKTNLKVGDFLDI